MSYDDFSITYVYNTLKGQDEQAKEKIKKYVQIHKKGFHIGYVSKIMENTMLLRLLKADEFSFLSDSTIDFECYNKLTTDSIIQNFTTLYKTGKYNTDEYNKVSFSIILPKIYRSLCGKNDNTYNDFIKSQGK